MLLDPGPQWAVEPVGRIYVVVTCVLYRVHKYNTFECSKRPCVLQLYRQIPGLVSFTSYGFKLRKQYRPVVSINLSNIRKVIVSCITTSRLVLWKLLFYCMALALTIPAFVILFLHEHIGIGSNSYEKLKTFKYLGSLLTNQNSLHEDIKCRLKAGNSCYYSFQTRLSSLEFAQRFWELKYIKQ